MTDIRNILLHVSAENLDPGSGPAAYARSMARAFGAHLTALVFELNVFSTTGGFEGVALAEGNTGIAERNRMADETAEVLRASLEGVDADVRTARSFAYGVPEIVAQMARIHDLTIAGIATDPVLSDRAIAEYALFQSGRPLLVVPGDHDGEFAARRIACAWDFGRPAARAVADAMPLLKQAEDVTLLTVGDDKSFDCSIDMDDVLAALGRHGIVARHARGERAGASIGDALQRMAREAGADLLVMGGYGHSRFREFVLGGATRGVLHDAMLPTFLSH